MGEYTDKNIQSVWSDEETVICFKLLHETHINVIFLSHFSFHIFTLLTTSWCCALFCCSGLFARDWRTVYPNAQLLILTIGWKYASIRIFFGQISGNLFRICGEFGWRHDFRLKLGPNTPVIFVQSLRESEQLLAYWIRFFQICDFKWWRGVIMWSEWEGKREPASSESPVLLFLFVTYAYYSLVLESSRCI